MLESSDGRKHCRKCLLVEQGNTISLSEDGTCSVCREYAEQGKKESVPQLESNLIRILKKFRGRSRYDCMVMCSGGKDSIMSLYLMRTRYQMNPLVFTFDHGFENEEALDNIRRAVEILDTDWVYYRTEYMRTAFIAMIEEDTVAPLCHLCAMWYIRMTYEWAELYGIPLIVAGWTRGQSRESRESGAEYAEMSRQTADFVRKVLRRIPKYKNFPTSMTEAVRLAKRSRKHVMISPHWYLEWEPEKMNHILHEQLGWRAPKESYPRGSTNCSLNFLSVHRTLRNFGYTHYHAEMSKQIRMGEMSRAEAEKLLAINFTEEKVEQVLQSLMKQ